MFVLFSAVGRFAGNGYVSADIVHIFRLFLSVGISLILLFSAVCCCLFFESFAVGILCGCCVFWWRFAAKPRWFVVHYFVSVVFFQYACYN